MQDHPDATRQSNSRTPLAAPLGDIPRPRRQPAGAALVQHYHGSLVEHGAYLQAVRDEGAWEDWVVFMLDAVAETSVTTNGLVIGIRDQMAATKRRMRDELPRLYSQDLLNNLFRHPYTRIEYVQNDLNVTRQTAAKYLDTLAEQGLVEKHRSGKSNYYLNVALVRLFMDASGEA